MERNPLEARRVATNGRAFQVAMADRTEALKALFGGKSSDEDVG
jgi:hypothetical protein